MKKQCWTLIALLFVIPGFIFATSCAKKVVQTKPSQIQEEQQAYGEGREQGAIEETGVSEEEAQAAREAAAKEAAMRKAREAREMFLNQDIHFDFDRSSLSLTAQEILKNKALWLQNNPGVSVIIEGHCDERGTNEYNLALGDRRAENTKSFLVDLGIESTRITTISYGEERPVDPGHNESAWQKNRRAHFVIE